MIVVFSHLPAGSWASPEPHKRQGLEEVSKQVRSKAVMWGAPPT